jgi:hypothetical protein
MKKRLLIIFTMFAALILGGCASTSWNDSKKMDELDTFSKSLSKTTGIPIAITPVVSNGGERRGVPVTFLNGRMIAFATFGDPLRGFKIFIPMRDDTWFSYNTLEMAGDYVKTYANGIQPEFDRVVVGSSSTMFGPIKSRIYMSCVTSPLPLGGSAAIVYVSSLDHMGYYAQFGGFNPPEVNQEWVESAVSELSQ